MGRAVAARRGISVGDQFSIGGITVTVAGVFACENPAEENYIYTHLDFLQRRQGDDRVGTVTQHEVLLAPGIDPSEKCEAIDALFRGGPVATDTRPKGVFQAKSLSDLADVIGMAHYLGLACVGMVLALVATTTLMSVQDRIKEHAVLQTLGFSGPQVFGMVLTESVLLSLAGGIVGVGAALVALESSSLAVGAEAVTVAFRPSLRLAATGVAAALVTGLLAGIVPAWQAARTEIVPALRQG
jgi:putative ABC transport system permease protein